MDGEDRSTWGISLRIESVPYANHPYCKQLDSSFVHHCPNLSIHAVGKPHTYGCPPDIKVKTSVLGRTMLDAGYLLPYSSVEAYIMAFFGNVAFSRIRQKVRQ